ncbi:MAG: hypothetical protein ABSD32_07305 [Mycobacterium sp.]
MRLGFAVELDQLDIEFGAHHTHGVLAEGEDLAGEHGTAVLRHENQVRAPAAVPSRRGCRHPPSRRSVARIKARRQAKAAMRQSRSARTSTTNQPTALAA